MALPMPRLPPVMTATLSVRSRRERSMRPVYRVRPVPAAPGPVTSSGCGWIRPDPADRTRSVEVVREAEEGEQPTGVEERVDPDDLAATGLQHHQRPRVVAAAGAGAVLPPGR